MTPSSIFARNAKPSALPPRHNHHVEPRCAARTVQYAAATMSSTMTASGLSKRNMRAATGVSARAAAATNAASALETRRTVA